MKYILTLLLAISVGWNCYFISHPNIIVIDQQPMLKTKYAHVGFGGMCIKTECIDEVKKYIPDNFDLMSQIYGTWVYDYFENDLPGFSSKLDFLMQEPFKSKPEFKN